MLNSNDFQQQQFGAATGLGLSKWEALLKRADFDSDNCITRAEFTQAVLMYAVDIERQALEEQCGRTMPLANVVASIQVRNMPRWHVCARLRSLVHSPIHARTHADAE